MENAENYKGAVRSYNLAADKINGRRMNAQDIVGAQLELQASQTQSLIFLGEQLYRIANLMEKNR